MINFILFVLLTRITHRIEYGLVFEYEDMQAAGWSFIRLKNVDMSDVGFVYKRYMQTAWILNA